MLSRKFTTVLAVASLSLSAWAPAQSASLLFLAPTADDVTDGRVEVRVDGRLFIPLGTDSFTLELFMDFDVITVGGGLDFAVSGPIALAGSPFAGSAFFNSLDPFFTGFSSPADGGLNKADNDLEVHWGSFTGITGANKIGGLNFVVDRAGLATDTDAIVAINYNSLFGPFINLDALAIPAVIQDGNGSLKITVQAVPLPATAWLLLTGIGAMVVRRFRRD